MHPNPRMHGACSCRHAFPLCAVTALLCGMLLVGLSAAVFAETHIVPDECPTIAAGIERADPGDTVLVRKGFYRETLIIQKPITLRGEGADTILTTAKPNDRNVILVFAPSGRLIIENLTVTGGECGIGILRTLDDSVMLRNLRIVENEAGIEVFGGTITEILDSYFVGNDCSVLLWQDACATITRNEMWLGQIGISIANSSSVTLSYNLIVSKVPIYVYGSFDECSLFRPRESFSGTVEGSGNKLLGLEHELLPSLDAPVWPDDFVASGFRTAALSCIGAFSDASKAHSIGALHTAEATYKSAFMAAKSLGMTLVVADAGFALGQLRYDSREYQDAAVWLETSLESHLHLGLIEETAEVRCLLASTYTLQASRKRDAVVALREAAFFTYLELGDVQARTACLSSLLSACRTATDAQAAIPPLERVLDACQELPDAQGEANTLEALAHVYYWAREYVMSIDFGRQAIACYMKLDDHRSIASTLKYMAFSYKALDNTSETLDLYDQVLAIYRALDDSTNIASTLWGKGKTLLEWDRYEEALQCLMESVDVYSSIEDRAQTSVPESEAWAVMDLADCHFALEEYAQAISAFETALKLGQSIRDEIINFTIRPRWGIGRCHRAVGDLEEARRDYEAAVTEAEAWAATQEQEVVRQSMYEVSFRRLYEEYLELLLKTGRNEETMFVTERCRARTFLDLLAMGPVGTLENVSEEGIRSGVVDTSVIKKDLAEVMAGLPENTAVLEYFVSEDTVYLWVVTQDGVSGPIRIEIGREVLIDRIVSFRKMLETPPTGGVAAASLELLNAARDLFELLIGPVEEKIAGFSHLVIVPSGPLYYLPFSALYRCPGCAGRDLNGGKFLVERFALSYAPSLTTLKYAQAIGAQTYPEPTFLGLADPDSGDPTIHRLPDAQKEAESIAALFSPRSEVYVDRQATEEVVQSCSATAREILFSTHGHFDPLNPVFSYLLLSPTGESDGKLYAHEIFSLPLRTNMVVLSACETLLPSLAQMTDQLNKIARRAGDDTPQELTEDQLKALTAGDEVVGLTRAFISAGASSVLSSLWSVPSGSTAALMVAFYGHLNEGLNKAEALRRAQMDVKEVYPHPWYWAAFNLMGDWR